MCLHRVPPGELTFDYVHVAMYAASCSFLRLVHTSHVQILSTVLRKSISNNRPIKGINTMKVIIAEKEKIISFKVNAKRI